MTYRKLFIHLLAGFTIILLLAWGYSLFRQPWVVIHTPRHGLNLSMRHGSMTVGLRTDEKALGTRYHIQSGNEIVPRDLRRIFGEWQSFHSTGKTGIYPRGAPRSPGGVPIGPPTVTTITTTRNITMPLWAPWLILTACTYPLCRVMEKRSTSGQEKELAGGISDGAT